MDNLLFNLSDYEVNNNYHDKISSAKASGNVSAAMQAHQATLLDSMILAKASYEITPNSVPSSASCSQPGQDLFSTGSAGLCDLLFDLPADAFEPIPIAGNNDFCKTPPVDSTLLERVLDQALGVATEPEIPLMNELPLIDINPRKHEALPFQPMAGPKPKRSRISSDAEPRFRGYQEKQWVEQFDVLVKFKEEHGNCLVPHTYPENPVLSRWVKRQRYQYKLKQAGKDSTMTDARIKKLEDIGFVWDSHACAWDKRFKELEQYYHAHGHCNVPSNFPENQELATWIKCQRRQFKLYMAGNKSSSMTPDRIQALNALGFIWKVREDLPPLPALPL